MLTRQNDVAPSDKYYADSLLTVPSFGSSVFDSLASGYATPTVARNMLDSQFAEQPEGRAIKSSLDSIQLETQTPGIGWTQWLADEGANMLGYALNPNTWALGALGEFGAKGITTAVGAGASRFLPDAASVFIRKPLKDLVSKPIGDYIPSALGEKSAGLLSDKTLSTFGTFAGAGIPQGIVDNFNNDTGHISWGGVARESGEMGAFGLAIGSIPFAWGLLRGKVNRGLGEDFAADVTQDKLNLALEKGSITPDEHKWYSDYLEHQKNPEDVLKTEELKDRASQIINQNGHTANTATNEAQFQILQPKDIDNLNGAISDQLSGNVPDEYREALSQYMVNNRMDTIRNDPNALDGVRGFVDFINDKLANKDEKLAEADEIFEKHGEKGMKDSMPFSQKELVNNLKKLGIDNDNITNSPITIPDNIKLHINQLKSIARLKSANKMLFKRYEKTGMQKFVDKMRENEAKIGEIEKNLEPILTPREEIRQIKQRMLGEKGLPKKFELSKDYHRLLDLSNVWHNARSLLDRIHLEHEYNKQEAFRDLAQHTLNVADSNLPKMANPDNVTDYLKRRIEGTLSKVEPTAKVEADLRERRTVPADAENILTEQEAQVKNSEATDAKKEFAQSSARYKEFKASDGIFKNLISCVLGAANA